MGQMFGDYELIRHIATGGMAEIYLARQHADLSDDGGLNLGLERYLVVKRMLPELAVRNEFVAMFLDEAKLTASLQHPHVVRVFDLGETDNAYYIAMELVDGPHLGAMFAHSLRAKKPLPIELCAFITARAADGLHYAHNKSDPATGQPLNLVHRDISPQNILVSRHGEVKVTDFGVAKASTQQNKTRTGVVKGKVSYMSPEQCLGDSIDARTDVFALGIVLYELLTRKRLFRDKSDLLIMQRITSGEIPKPSSVNANVDAALDDIVMRALARGVGDRYQTANDLAEALDRWLIGKKADELTLSSWFEANCKELAPTQTLTNDATQASVMFPPPPSEATTQTPSYTTKRALNDAPPVPAEATVVSISVPELQDRPNSVEADVDLEANPALLMPAAWRPAMIREDGSRTPDKSDGSRPMAENTAKNLKAARVPSTALDDFDHSAAQSGAQALPPAESPPAQDAVATEADAFVEEPDLPTLSAPTVSTKSPKPTVLMAAGAGLLALITIIAIAVTAGIGTGSDVPEVPEVKDAGTETPTVVEATTSKLTVTSVPAGAVIIVADRVVGPAPITIDVERGTASVQAQFDGQPAQQRSIVVDDDTQVEFLARVPLTIRSVPPKAKVRINDELLGETPFDRGYLAEPGVPLSLRLEPPSIAFAVLEQEIVPTAGKPLSLTLTLPPAKKKAPVVDEGMGSLSMRTEPWAIVSSGRLSLGETPFAERPIPAGKHTLSIRNPQSGLDDKLVVTIIKDTTTVVILKYVQEGGVWKATTKTVR